MDQLKVVMLSRDDPARCHAAYPHPTLYCGLPASHREDGRPQWMCQLTNKVT